MIRFVLVTLVLFFGPLPALHAEGDSPLKLLRTGDDSRGWEAVGRLNIDDRAMCTGTLIAPDLVLTAAHCLFDRDTGKRIPASRIEFLAGWRNGWATAREWGKRAAILPDYVFDPHQSPVRVQHDIALLRLSRPIRKTSITPFATAGRPAKWDKVEVVSYARDRAQSPSLQESCRVLARQSGTLILSCDVDFGSSGAPVFVRKDGVPRVALVISAKAEVGQRKVSLAAAVEDRLELLMQQIEAAPPVRNGLPVVHRPGYDRRTGTGGARFIRP